MPLCKLPAQHRSGSLWVPCPCVCVPVFGPRSASPRSPVREACTSPAPGPRMAAESVEVGIREHIDTKYLRSTDIENPDSIDFCAYFEGTYGNKLDELKDKFQKIESFLRQDGWNPQEHITTVVSENQMIRQNVGQLPGSLDLQRRTV